MESDNNRFRWYVIVWLGIVFCFPPIIAAMAVNNPSITNISSDTDFTSCRNCITQDSSNNLHVAEKIGSQFEVKSVMDISDIYSEPTAASGKPSMLSHQTQLQNLANDAWEHGKKVLLFDDDGNIVKPYGITATPLELLLGAE